MLDYNCQVILIGLQGLELSQEEMVLLQDFSPGGVVLFNRNIESPAQVAALCESIYKNCELPPLITIDQEGGLVSRLRPILKTMETEKFAGLASPEQIRELGELTGNILALLGIGLNFAPVVDIKYSDADNALKTRYWGGDKKTVVRRAGHFLEGMKLAGTPGCLKHFPGLGNTSIDSHIRMPVNNTSLDSLLNDELYPYAMLKDEAEMVMVAHCHYPALDEEKQIPASASPEAYRILRNEIGFAGVAITDDLGMGGISNEIDLSGRIRETLNAGANLLPFCNNPLDIARCFPTLNRLILAGDIDKSRLDFSLKVIADLKDKLPDEYVAPDNIKDEFNHLAQSMNVLNQEVLKNE